MLKDFFNFIMKGNVMDLAVAVIMGAAFSGIVTSLVEDVITPGALNPVMETMQAENLEGLEWNGILYGKFLAAVLNFLIIGIVIFILVKIVSTVQKKIEERFLKEEKEQPKAPTDVELLAEIRDLLKEKKEG